MITTASLTRGALYHSSNKNIFASIKEMVTLFALNAKDTSLQRAIIAWFSVHDVVMGAVRVS
ncbi:hypothetical protein KSX_52780 [Ktedonospora formicarum]|uniref:Uncharacterized protein n=1 Tax=Ktedonospora formicarum TaxID=2778364 RepID=A0A8J3I5H6_9CHLR|nr:hypothetical protein KSX_52780 [Ktedonospora formicarum]